MCVSLSERETQKEKAIHIKVCFLSYHYLVPYNLIHVHCFALNWETLVKTNLNPSVCQSYLRLKISDGRISSFHEYSWKVCYVSGTYCHVGWQEVNTITLRSFPRWLSGKESAYLCRRRKRYRFNPWVGKIP